jgi:hypothetical protein
MLLGLEKHARFAAAPHRDGLVGYTEGNGEINLQSQRFNLTADTRSVAAQKTN